MKLDRRFDTVRATAILIVTLFTLAGLGACKDHFDEEERERAGQAKPAPTATSADNGQSYLTLDPSTQARLGLQVATLKAIVTREQTNAPAVVLSALDLVTFRNNCLAAQAQLQKSRIATDVATKEYARLKSLFEQDQNISEKALQSAEGNLQASEADEHLDEEQLKLQEPLVRQKWGDAVAKWVVEGTPELQRIFNEQEALVQVTIPSAAPFGPPKALSLEIPGGTRMEASFVSQLPRMDPRIQGKTFLYRMAAYPGLSPGTNLVSHFSIGNPMRGVVVPVSAVVWSEGKAWVYEQTAADRFTRSAVTTDSPVEEGFLVTAGLSAGDKIVTQGAQDLLSEELLAHSQQGIDTDDD
jgi:membrane fusion protein, multidrug efflux system